MRRGPHHDATCATMSVIRLPAGQKAESVPAHEGNDVSSARNGVVAEYEDSSCYLYYDQASPDGMETLVQQHDVWHFNEICITSSKVSTECSNRLYVMERTPGFRFEGTGDREIFAVNRTDCESKCINEESFKCRSCSSDLCSATALILEAGKELEGAYERDLFSVRDFKDCSDKCIHSLTERGFMCRSFLYYDKSKTCVLYPDDPVGDAEGPDVQKPLKPSTGDLYRLFCGTSDRERSVCVPPLVHRWLAINVVFSCPDALINNLTFECYRRKRLDGPHQAETKSYSFQECLDECMRKYGRDCRSVEYSSRYQSCRFSRYDGSMKPSLVDDDFYDYYEFKWFRGVGGNAASGGFRRRPRWTLATIGFRLYGRHGRSGKHGWSRRYGRWCSQLAQQRGSAGGSAGAWSGAGGAGGSSMWSGGGGSAMGGAASWPSSGGGGGGSSAPNPWSSGGGGLAAGGWASGPPDGWTSGWTSSGLFPSVGGPPPPPGPVLPPWAGAHFGWPALPPLIGPHSAPGPHFPSTPLPPPYPPIPPPELCGKSGGIGTFKKIGYGMRLRSHFVIRVVRADLARL
ncbi:uncharacterized protein CEXT_310221 [Caerostris extrusa]|uniref:Apple domain-containing protein n=1 Tax=Caerostris extrusa TaxID=172846 RepID=A0AAV4TEY3_CAEEX|nr:uncharacterized protein CEXT_310221 [Caerostris extrusa]